ncbi:hypothetical protein M407DRAFT_32891 [Tulasnella calospora MUT 4182]|uniref:Uncharacterized protein n=1 Tax=Tulasnella calospora MUT 4182 TaxID=1051891 RepID=A0A0C3Q3Z1_9AGAM|nr:hypothetical protein M407DRAFT_32891 [Tulasnella calospora MUT 4182]
MLPVFQLSRASDASRTKITTTAKDATASPGNVDGNDSVNPYNSARLLYNDRNDAKERHCHPRNVYGDETRASYDPARLLHDYRENGKGRHRHPLYVNLAAHRTTRPASCTKIATTPDDAIATARNVYSDCSHASYDPARLLHKDRNNGKGCHRHPRECLRG